MTGFQPIGYEFAAELTFPEPDGPVSGIMNISTQIFGIVITLLISGIQQILGDLIGNMVSCTVCLLYDFQDNDRDLFSWRYNVCILRGIIACFN